MRNVRNVLIGLVLSALVVGIVVSCGGGGGGYGGGGSMTTATTYTVGGTLSIPAGSAVLRLNGAGDMTVTAGGFTFPNGLAYLSTFNVQAIDAAHTCAVTNGAGTIGLANVTNVTVTCATPGAETIVRSTLLNGAQENPAVTSGGSGTGGLVVDPTSGAINGGVTVFNITPTVVKLLEATVGTPNEIATLGSAGDGQTYFIPTNTPALTALQVASLRAGNFYFDVFTAGHPATTASSTGEIRGLIEVQGGVLAGVAAMNFAQELAGGTDTTCTSSTSIGQGTVIADRATGVILISYMTHDVGANIFLAHIHTSNGPMTTGNVRVTFVPMPAINYPMVPGQAMAPQDIADFLADHLYFNIHNKTNCPSGEIRGNITHLE